jgi:hypothetical protein
MIQEIFGTRFKFVSAILILIFFSTNAACMTWRDFPIQNASSTAFEATKKYEIIFTNGAKIEAKGDHLLLREDEIGVMAEGQSNYVFYARDQSQSIRVRQISTGKTVGLVAGILAGIGAIIGGSIAAIHSACSTSNACN